MISKIKDIFLIGRNEVNNCHSIRIGKQLGIKEWKDWYTVNTSLLFDYGVSSILNYHQNSIVAMLTTVYSEYPWQIWKFEQVINRFV